MLQPPRSASGAGAVLGYSYLLFTSHSRFLVSRLIIHSDERTHVEKDNFGGDEADCG